MTPSPPRVAYFPDSFHEVNGVAHTSRHFEAFARRRDLPFLCVRAGDRAPGVHRRRQCVDAGAAARLSLLCTGKRSALRPGVSASHSADRGSAGALQAGPDSHYRAERGGDAGRGAGASPGVAAGRKLAHQCARVPGAALGLVSAAAAAAALGRQRGRRSKT